MAMIFQDPLSAMNPYYTVGHQIIEAYRIHNPVNKKVARKHAIDMLGRVGIPEPSQRVDAYPHQFSGGMRQRAMIAMALSCDPDLLIADEPTTALDVTVQAQILDLIRDLQSEFNSAVVLITHDLGVVAEIADDVLVMYAGRAMEYGSADQIFNRPAHPYTWGLLGSVPRFDRPRGERLLATGHAARPIHVPSAVRSIRAPTLPAERRLMRKTSGPNLLRSKPATGACHPLPDQQIWEHEIALVESGDAYLWSRRTELELIIVEGLVSIRRPAEPPGRRRPGGGRGELRRQTWRDVFDRR
jgi:peptide/nickel transport system ATP-binding protein